MDINASIIDQQLDGIVQDHAGLLPRGNDPVKLKSTAFVLLCVSTLLDYAVATSVAEVVAHD